MSSVDTVASSLISMGAEKGDRVTICLPNTPHAVIMFYAVNKIGAVAVMVHPLSSKKEVEFYVKDSGSRIAVTMDRFCGLFEGLEDTTVLEKLIITDVSDSLHTIPKIVCKIRSGKVPKAVMRPHMISWEDMLSLGSGVSDTVPGDIAVILYTGGTTGTPKGVLLSNLNFNATAIQTYAMVQCEMTRKDSLLGILPMFHGLGLCIGTHMPLINSMKLILMPSFSSDSFAKFIKKKRPTFIVGVPTLFELMVRNKRLEKADLSYIRGVFSGGDTLTETLKKRVDRFLTDRGSPSVIREGYGLTECVAASCLTPADKYRTGSVGIPFPDTFYKVVAPDTADELPYGSDGEICISGPSVMVGYNNSEETANVLRRHDDGRTWLHTGDVGMMDEEGFVYFRQRIKRMIVSSGYNIYPGQIENMLDSHPDVCSSCVIGVPDEIKVQSVKAFVVLNDNVACNETVKRDIMNYCKENVAKYAIPTDIEFIDELPWTKMGKVAYTELEKLEMG
jgi:long-chain acyl-CoA synthetase